MSQSENQAPKIIVNVAPRSGTRTVLVRYRARPDQQTGWFVPHAELAASTHPEAAAAAVLQRQLGLSAAKLQIKSVDSFTGKDRSWHLPMTFAADVSTIELVLGPDVLEARWFDRTELPSRRDVAHGGWGLDLLAEVWAD